MAAVDMFLKITDIKGESADASHKDEIEVLSFSWGATQTGSFAHGGGGGSGKVQVHDLHFVANIHKASPVLMQKCCTGEHLKEAVLSVRKAGGTQQDYLKIEMSDCLISSYSASYTPPDELPVEGVSINFVKVVISVAPQDPKGTLGPPVTGCCG